MPKNTSKSKTRRNKLPPGARYVNTIQMHPRVSLDSFRVLYEEIMSIPVYLILCHGAICKSYADCEVPRKEKGSPKFMIPESTYILNVTSGGEYCMYSPADSLLFKEEEQNLRKLLLIDDRNDTVLANATGYPLLTTLMRATEVDYPNIRCSFTDPILTDLGIYNLSTTDEFISKNSLFDVQRGTAVWLLDDLIAETYRVTGNSKGIFLFTGCTSGFRDNAQTAKAVDDAETLLYLAETSYSRIKPTLSVERLKGLGAVPTTIRTIYPLYEESVAEKRRRLNRERNNTRALNRSLHNMRKSTTRH